jgi:hypothetical protein
MDDEQLQKLTLKQLKRMLSEGYKGEEYIMIIKAYNRKLEEKFENEHHKPNKSN